MPSGAAQFTVDGAMYGARVELTGGKGAASVSGLAVGARDSGRRTFAAADAGPGATRWWCRPA
ncbi:hypothetical protein NCC78_05665 [Micromonospora phytophila]|uniref:hypothetical protein n=1 Tax=Micromonospora phytophila TaxID=709888 RepID=UPI00202FDD8B|nr:hypothetical protein [Micromonospora phytophila]MCM0674179.1 hypothetical protein [Micromonospora phytophila]